MKSEIRNPKSERNPKLEIRNPNSPDRTQCGANPFSRAVSDFGFRASFGFRISDFGFSRSLLCALSLALLAAGCTSKTNAKLEAQKAFMAGQQQAWERYQQMRPNVVRIVGPVQFPTIDWHEDLTLAQALVAARYILAGEPRLVLVTRGQEQVQFTARQLLKGQDVPLQAGDVVEVRP